MQRLAGAQTNTSPAGVNSQPWTGSGQPEPVGSTAVKWEQSSTRTQRFTHVPHSAGVGSPSKSYPELELGGGGDQETKKDTDHTIECEGARGSAHILRMFSARNYCD